MPLELPSTVTLPHLSIIGKAGAGKTTAAKFLEEHYGYTKLAFADPLKTIAMELWGANAMTDRGRLQKLGVAVREIDESAWCELMMRELSDPVPDWRVVVDDCRFPNEAAMLGAHGFVFVRVRAPVSRRVDRLLAIGKLQDESQLIHESEVALDGFKADYTIYNDGTVEELQEQLVAVLRKEANR